MSSLLTVCLSIFLGISDSTILLGESSIIENNTVNIAIDTELNEVKIKLSHSISTPFVWNGFGFDSNVMDGAYTIIMDYIFPQQTPIVIEYTLDDHAIGSIYSEPAITVISDINDGITRTVNLKRSINGTYSFPTTATAINVMSAIGQQFDFNGCTRSRQQRCRHSVNGRNTS